MDHMDAADRYQSGDHVLLHGHHAGPGLRNGFPLGHSSTPLARNGLHSAPSVRSFQNSVLPLKFLSHLSRHFQLLFSVKITPDA